MFFETSTREQSPRQAFPGAGGIENAFTPRGQLTISDNVHSIQLQRRNSTGSAPILRLGSNDQLRLRFETLGFDSRQFQIRFTHHNPDWSNSGLPPDFFMDGFQTAYISGGQASRETQPSYRQFQFDFPSRDFSFTFSGNYMLHVEDADNGNLIFTLPFFIYENQGSVTSSVQTQITPRHNLRTSHHPVSRYQLPQDISQPQFDLEFYYVQNRFWGKMRRAAELDFSAPDHVQFEMRRENGFIGDYEFRWLSFTNISQTEPGIAEVDLTDSPPVVILDDDAEGFSPPRPQNGLGRTGFPNSSLNARYAHVIFRFDHRQTLPENSEIYLVGDFNQWSIQAGNRLRYVEDIDRWQTSAVMKTGRYHYKYVLLRGNEVDDLFFDDRFTRGRQEYHAMVYKRDQARQVYRLLQVNHFFEDS